MPHLDAQALADDPKGMEFLASILEVDPVQAGRCFGRPELVRIADIAPPSIKLARQRRRKLVPEAA